MTLSPGDAFASLIHLFTLPSGSLLLLTGPRGSGKTGWCQNLFRLAQIRGLRVGGVISPALLQDGRKTGIALQLLPEKEERVLARSRTAANSPSWSKNWHIDETVLAWANRHLARVGEVDVLIIDELGPLEFEFGRGLQNAFPLLDERRYGLAAVVVRPSLLPRAQKRWPWARIITLPESAVHD